MLSQTIRTLLVETDAGESRHIQRALKVHPLNGKNSGPQWKLERAATVEAAIKRLAQETFDVILVGLRSHRSQAQQRLRQLRAAAPRVPVLAIVDIEDQHILDTACALIATNAFYQRRPSLPAAISAVVLPGRAHATDREIRSLTPRERQIFQIIAEGNSTKQVAELLGISVKTAETHRTNLMRKLSLRSVGQLVRYAIRHEIVQA